MQPTEILVPVFQFVLRASMLGGLLIIMLLPLRSLLNRRLSPSYRSWMWLPVAALLFLPALPNLQWNHLPSLPQTIAPALNSTTTPEPAVQMRIAITSNTNTSPIAPVSPPPTKQPLTLFEIASLLWISIASALLTWGLASHLWLIQKIRRSPSFHPVPSHLQSLFQSCCHECRLRFTPRLIITDAIQHPAATGLFRPIVLLPPTLDQQLSRAELRHILLHEITHIKRGDLPCHWFSMLLLAIHWFNPLCWIAARCFRADREAACDASVLNRADSAERHAYGSTLLNFQQIFPAALPHRTRIGLLGSADLLRQRIHDIAHFKTWSSRFAWLTHALVLALSAAIALAAAEPKTLSIEPTKASPQSEELQSRTFRVPPDFLSPGTPSGVDGKPNLRVSAKQLLEGKGITFPDGATATFVPASSILIVRHTRQALQQIEGFVERLYADRQPPKQIYLTMKVVTYGTAPDTAEWKELGNFKAGKGAFLKYSRTYTDPQFQLIMRALSQHTGYTPPSSPLPYYSSQISGSRPLKTSIIVLPSVTTRSGRPAVIEIIKEINHWIDADPNDKTSHQQDGLRSITTSHGVHIETTPLIGADGQTIALEINPVFNVFGGWSKGTTPSGKNVDIPIFHWSHPQKQTMTIWDGDTVEMNGFLYSPILPPDAAHAVDPGKTPPLLAASLYITAKLIDPFGAPLTRNIVLPKVTLDNTSLPDALNTIRELCKNLNPPAKVPNIILRHPDKEPPRVSLHLENVTLHDALQGIAHAAGLQVTVEDNTFVLSPKK